MIYLRGNPDDPKYWYTCTGKYGPKVTPEPFPTEKEVRMWVINELDKRIKEMSMVRHQWKHPKDKSATEKST